MVVSFLGWGGAERTRLPWWKLRCHLNVLIVTSIRRGGLGEQVTWGLLLLLLQCLLWPRGTVARKHSRSWFSCIDILLVLIKEGSFGRIMLSLRICSFAYIIYHLGFHIQEIVDELFVIIVSAVDRSIAPVHLVPWIISQRRLPVRIRAILDGKYLVFGLNLRDLFLCFDWWSLLVVFVPFALLLVLDCLTYWFKLLKH